MKRQIKTLETVMNRCFHTVSGKSGVKIFSLFIALFFFGTKASFAGVGEDIYNKMCMTCHSVTDKALVGPGLKGVADRRSEEWLIKWIKNPQAVLDAGDKDAVKLFNDYNKVPMPGFPQLKDEEIKELIAFFKEKSKDAGPTTTTAASTGGSTTPASGGDAAAPGTVDDLTGTFIFWGIVAIAVIWVLLYRFRKKTFNDISTSGMHQHPHYIPNYAGTFFMYAAVGLGLIFLTIYFLQQKESMVNSMLFVALPYVSLGVFLIGSIYRYLNRGYQVSSLSSQFLEGKKLFWGSQPFHWGILVLFLGHLTAFLFPRAILAWNGEPVRLLILEVSSFAFALSALFGLAMLIRRRLTTKMVLVVTNKMDLVVYTVLLTQIISGIGVAFFVRWGSSWFSSVLTPYLRSVFSFNPDITAVSEMPVWIQLHIVSAFVIIGIIPFTRFMHFLVAPIDYIWRKYQVVIWNWNKDAIRTSTRHNFGKRPRNH